MLDDIETVLGIRTCPVNWPIGSGKRFKGIYDRRAKTVRTFESVSTGGAKSAAETDYDIDDSGTQRAGRPNNSTISLIDEIELFGRCE